VIAYFWGYEKHPSRGQKETMWYNKVIENFTSKRNSGTVWINYSVANK